MKKMDFDTFCDLLDALDAHKYDWTFEQFRAYRQERGVDRETIIPSEYLTDLLDYRYAEYSPKDYGMNGKFSEVKERIEKAVARGKALRWNDFNARKAGRRDLSHGSVAMEKKSGAGDWLVSYTKTSADAIVEEYSQKRSYIHWEVEDLGIDIECRWCELMEYLSHYQRKAGGPEMGASYWFKNKTKAHTDGDRWILEIQTYRNSEKKLSYILACPYNKK